jgi:phosphoribosylformylglycinamidine cyclo-ligase
MSDKAGAYKDAGVDIAAGNAFVESIRNMVAKTHIKGVVGDIGGFGGMFKPDTSGMKDPVLVASTDGVGTKLKCAFAFGKHDTVGIDLVAMCANDIIVQGAQPLFFLDYFATGKLDGKVGEEVLAGIVEGCVQAGCALLGGETAEMPGFYADGEYDLSGFCVGLVDNEKIVDGSSIRVGDAVIGLASSGLHSNGYSLVRKVLKNSGLKGEDTLPGSDASVAEVLLTPTRIYVPAVKSLLRDLEIKAMVHVTGGGFYENIPRVLPKGVGVSIEFGAWPIMPVFSWLQDEAGVEWPEMLTIFNCGIGFVLIVSPEHVDEVLARLEGLNEAAWLIGRVERLKDAEDEQVVVDFG